MRLNKKGIDSKKQCLFLRIDAFFFQKQAFNRNPCYLPEKRETGSNSRALMGGQDYEEKNRSRNQRINVIDKQIPQIFKTSCMPYMWRQTCCISKWIIWITLALGFDNAGVEKRRQLVKDAWTIFEHIIIITAASPIWCLRWEGARKCCYPCNRHPSPQHAR